MSTVLEQTAASSTALAPLRNGDRLDQPTYHERYAAMPDGFQAELIGGIVFVSSPVSKLHAIYHARVITWLGNYSIRTPGTEVLDNGTVILDDENEPQPDALLRIDDERGGRSVTTKEGYLAGSPELHVEVAYSSESIDLHAKRHAYEQGGVGEYLIVLVRENMARGFLLTDGQYVEQPLTENQIWRSAGFPGLWLDVSALIQQNGDQLLQTLRQGLGSDEHQTFVKQLEAAKSARHDS